MNSEIDISSIILYTERLTLRPWKQEDLKDLFEYASVPGVGEMAGWEHHADAQVSQIILDDFISGKKTFALDCNGKVIGSLGIEKYDEERFPEFAEKRCREIGYVLAKPYWGKGLMPEAVREVLRWLFEDEKLDVVFCGHYLRNTQSARVQEKCGFHHYDFGKHETRMGTIEDDEINILTREEWVKFGMRNEK